MADDLDNPLAAGRHKPSILGESSAARDSATRFSLRGQAANLLSAFRLVAAIVWVAVFATAPGATLALGAIGVAAAVSDFFDGRLARRLSASGTTGRWLDGAADVIFVLAVLVSEASAGAIPAYIPILIALSFLQYTLDSLVVGAAGRGPIRSRLGHWGGVINYALAIALSFAPPPALVGVAVRRGAPLVALFYLAAIAERAVQLYRRKH